MAEYHVGCTMSGICAGTLKKSKKEWLNKSVVTDEALTAVANWLYFQIKKGDNSFGYAWKTKEGKILSLVCTVQNEQS